MAGYSLQTSATAFKGGKNILASEHFQFIEGGATLTGSAGTLEVGTAIARNVATGKFEAYTTTTGYDEFSILNVDVTLNGTDDVVVGEVIVRGSVYDAKLIGVNTAFKDANKAIRYVKHI